MKFITRKKVAAVGAAAAVLSASGVAYAFISGGSGDGTGSASVKSSLTVNNLAPVATVSDLVPGAGASATSVAVTNPNTYSVQYNKIHLAVDTANIPTGCDASWFTVGSDVTGTQTAAPGANAGVTGPTVTMSNASADQTNCLGKTIPLIATLSSS